MDGHTRKTQFRTASGETLAAALEFPAETPRAFALFAHCFSCTKDIKAAREIARALRAQGIAVLRFDFTGLGASEGDFANTNFSSNVADLVSAADYLREEFQAPEIIIGHSLGGAAALVAAGQIPETKGVVTIGAPAEADHVALQIKEQKAEIEAAGMATVLLAGRPFTIKKQFLDDLSQQNVLAHVSALKKPLLVMHAPLDATVGVENATQIFTAAKHPKSFVSLDTADHLLSDIDDARYAAQVLAVWASRFLSHERANVVSTKASEHEYHGGALAKSITGEPLAVQLSVDGHSFVIDASRGEGGSDLGPNPTRMVEAALSACAVMTMKMYAGRKGWALDQAEVTVRRGASTDEHAPQVLVKDIAISGDLDEAQRKRLHEIADKCPVHRLLSAGVEVQSRLS